MSGYDFDLFVIGGGSGGVRAARIAAGYGAKVAIAEEYRFGGTCVIRGCVPKKLLVYASRFRDDFADAVGFGFSVSEPRFDWATLIAHKDAEIARLEAAYRSGVESAGATVFDTRAELIDAHTIRLSRTGARVSADKILLAVGGHPVVPKIPGAELAITSNEVFHLAKLPRSIAIVGGGYISAEFASIFHGLGTTTTVLYRGEKILRGFDEDLRDGLSEEFAKRGIDVRCRVEIAAIEPRGSRRWLALTDGRTLEVDQVLYATGRVPNTAALGLEGLGIALGAQGQVLVDELGRSSCANIYAIGDVTHRVNLTPVAIREGHAFADAVFGGRARPMDRDFIPSAVFATPEVATVGLPEHLARQRFSRVDIYKSRFRPLKHTLSGRNERMLVKLVVEAPSDRVVGCHVLGADAAEIVQMAAIALQLKATKADFDATVALHPTAAEELVTLRQKWAAPLPQEASLSLSP
jgi:glutathione reductase (NADPH)